ncbi:MAG: amidohydrolase family protein, partial [Verrucomicrobiota bacterium]
PFCNLDPRNTDREDLIGEGKFDFLLEQYRELGFKGLGELCPNLPWDDPRMLNLLGSCERVGFPVTFHTISPEYITYGVYDELGLPGLETVLKKFPELKIFGHSAAFWSEISGDLTKEEKDFYPSGPVVEGGAITRLMRKYPNLYGDLSGGSGLFALQRDPDHAWRFIDEFQDRLMFGMDCCSTTTVLDHVEWLTQARDDGNITEAAFEKIMWKNINEALDLNLDGEIENE